MYYPFNLKIKSIYLYIMYSTHHSFKNYFVSVKLEFIKIKMNIQ